MQPRIWDIFCRVIDNLGDVGTCWRLARGLAVRGAAVRLVIDDASALHWLAPGGAPGVEVLPWPGPDTPGDVVIEALGCDPPPAYVQAMAATVPPPAWFNVEHLSAEPYVERCHGLPSPQPSGLVKRFHFPGFTPRTGGLMREPDLVERRATFDRAAWLAAQAIPWRPGERLVSLFCYDDTAAIPALLDDLAGEPTLLLLTPGAAQRQAGALSPVPAGLRLHALDWLSQADYDHLLWSCDVNFVRGEDSLVRAIWAGSPFVWQAYRQHDGAHHAKVDALLETMGAGPDVAAAWRSWNGSRTGWPGLPDAAPWRDSAVEFRRRLLGQPDLVSTLMSQHEADKELKRCC